MRAAPPRSFTESESLTGDARCVPARTGIAALAARPTGAFYRHMAAVVDRLNAEYAESELNTSKIDSTELKEAFDEVRECR